VVADDFITDHTSDAEAADATRVVGQDDRLRHSVFFREARRGPRPSRRRILGF
jgi:hypothetical protein